MTDNNDTKQNGGVTSNVGSTVAVIECVRCGHRWIPRKVGIKPRLCPNTGCHSPYWDLHRVREKKK